MPDQLDGGAGIAGVSRSHRGDGGSRMERNDPYLILLRRELTRALARLARAERERDRAIATLARLQFPASKIRRGRPAKKVRRTRK